MVSNRPALPCTWAPHFLRRQEDGHSWPSETDLALQNTHRLSSPVFYWGKSLLQPCLLTGYGRCRLLYFLEPLWN